MLIHLKCIVGGEFLVQHLVYYTLLAPGGILKTKDIYFSTWFLELEFTLYMKMNSDSQKLILEYIGLLSYFIKSLLFSAFRSSVDF